MAESKRNPCEELVFVTIPGEVTEIFDDGKRRYIPVEVGGWPEDTWPKLKLYRCPECGILSTLHRTCYYCGGEMDCDG